MNSELLEWSSMFDLVLRFGINLLVVILLVRFIYYRVKKEREFAFSFILTNILIFFLCYMMSGAQISVGFAFGLFAVFGILRYRTTTLPIKEMTYLFASIAVALMNGLATNNIALVELIFINLAILSVVYLLEKLWKEEEGQKSKKISYERIDLIEQGDEVAIIEDLKNRTGLMVTHYIVKNINFVESKADLRVFYDEEKD
jgi:uncharacterized membrane protein